MKHFLHCACFLLVAWPVQALDWKPYAVLAAGQALDTASTIRFLQTGHCVEGNSLYGRNPSPSKLVLTTVPIVAGTAALAYLTRNSPHKVVRVIGKIPSYAGGIVGAAYGLKNIRACGF